MQHRKKFSGVVIQLGLSLPIFPPKSLVIIMKVPARLTQYPQLGVCARYGGAGAGGAAQAAAARRAHGKSLQPGFWNNYVQ